MRDEMKKGFDYNLVKFLVSIIDAKSMSGASELLGLAPSGVSYAVNKLRDHYGDPLFIKSKKGIQPTPLAMKLYILYQPIIEGMELASEVHNLDIEHKVVKYYYNVSANNISEYWLSFHALKRGVISDSCCLNFITRSHDPEERINQLRRRKIDLDIGFGLPRDANIYSELLFNIEFTIVCSNQHPRVGNKITQKQFFQERHFIWASSDHYSQLSTSVELMVAEKKRNAWLSSDSFLSMLAIVSSSDLLMFVPKFYLSLIASEFSVREVQADFLPKNKTPIYGYMHKTLVNDPTIRQLIEIMKEDTRLA
ncbi:LysR family transcriptional regulator [Serratia fonticola]|uniref:LysR family transcriptional regulator n=1 Tax=Serratia fonticola TaxID=47917 RepID=UPI0027F43AD9|nr:LysR family transcriptional regulator [Serratia fonticola]MDQ7212042.1 LysR family transcriptional regulator [Serratia fonticola]HBE9082903.1 LysR family transcriptional regulator [Serratia fonticola]HBE9093392.1 LysR family transcriptional regulator [Serratia fonticola]HBE9155755.1 LysR family transcriptional regulator [Serratia fonticola]